MQSKPGIYVRYIDTTLYKTIQSYTYLVFTIQGYSTKQSLQYDPYNVIHIRYMETAVKYNAIQYKQNLMDKKLTPQKTKKGLFPNFQRLSITLEP